MGASEASVVVSPRPASLCRQRLCGGKDQRRAEDPLSRPILKKLLLFVFARHGRSAELPLPHAGAGANKLYCVLGEVYWDMKVRHSESE